MTHAKQIWVISNQAGNKFLLNTKVQYRGLSIKITAYNRRGEHHSQIIGIHLILSTQLINPVTKKSV